MLVDSNIIVYAALPEHERLREFIAEHAPAVSVVSHVEVLGCHRLEEEERRHFEEFFEASELLGITHEVIQRAVKLRQTRKMSLGDSLAAATALAHGLALVTRNDNDFDWIPSLTLLNPFTE